MLSHETLLVVANFLLVIVTALMVWTVWLQVEQQRKQTELARLAADREIERHTPDIRVHMGTGSIQAGGMYQVRESMTIVNAGIPDVIIESVGIVPANLASDDPVSVQDGVTRRTMKILGFPSPSYTYVGVENTTDSPFPLRLKTGEFVTIYSRKRDIIETLEESYRPIRRVRFQCQDTLGRRYASRYWLAFDENGKSSWTNDPGPGMVEPEL